MPKQREAESRMTGGLTATVPGPPMAVVLGPCRLADGTLLDEYRTCYAETHVVVHGGRKARETACGTCGSVRVRKDHAPPWVLRGDLEQAEVWLDPAGSLLVPGHVAHGMDVEQWLGLRCWPVSVRSSKPRR